MGSDAVISRIPIEWGVAARALPGEACSGDLHLVKPVEGCVLLAVVDGVGHGREATEAANIAVNILERYPKEPLVSLVRRCHAALMKARGVVMTLAFLDPVAGTLAWLGVGNVEGLLLRATPGAKARGDRVILRGGLVGHVLPELRTDVVPIAAGDLLVFVTDGIRAGFSRDWLPSDPPQQVADHILQHHSKPTDDALALVVRYLGGGHG